MVEEVLPLIKNKYLEKTNQELPKTGDLTITLTRIKRASKETLGEFV